MNIVEERKHFLYSNICSKGNGKTRIYSLSIANRMRFLVEYCDKDGLFRVVWKWIFIHWVFEKDSLFLFVNKIIWKNAHEFKMCKINDKYSKIF